MNREEFLAELKEVLQRDEAVTPEMNLIEIPEWDSLALMAVSECINHNFGMVLSLDDFREFQTVEDILKKAGC